MASPTEGPKMKAEDVLNALEELSREELNKFKWFLQQPENLPGVQPIKTTHLKEAAEGFKIVDLMVKTYSLQGCLEVASTILEKINRKDLLEKLLCYEIPENKICPLHKTSLDMMSSDGKTLVCRFCSLTDYKQFIPQSMEYRGLMTDSEIQEKIKMREMKIHQMKELLRIREDAADKYKAEKGPKMKAEDVLNALEELSQEEFDQFKWFLQQPENLPGVQPIKTTYLEEAAEGFKIVDLMVKTYSLQGCLEVTSTILEKINRKDLLEKLLCYEIPENKMCSRHKTSLNMMSSDGKTLVCRFCSLSDYKQFIPQSMEYRGLMTDSEIQEKIKMREMKIHQMKELLRIRKDAADKYKAEKGQKVETAEGGQQELSIKDEQETAEKEAEEAIKAQEQEIAELLKRSSELKLHQSDSSMKGKVKKGFPYLKETAKKMLELERVRQFAVDVTLDPDTAHPKLILSRDGKQVKHGNNWKKLPDNPERFTVFAKVLGQQSFSSGKFYFEVQVKEKTHWDVGVARESVDRKGEITVSIDDGIWALVLRHGNRYSTGEDTSDLFNLFPGPEKVGVFVDYDEGLVSFYDADTADLICSFTDCDFLNEKLRPYFCPYLNYRGTNSAPLVICPVNHC